MQVQILLGSDIAMQLDECVRLPAERSEIERAMKLSLRWAERSKRAFENAPSGRALFGIVQGGDDPDLRIESARSLGWHRLRWLRDRRPCRRRAAGRDAQSRCRNRAGVAAGQAALSHGRRHPSRPARGDRPRHRYVRLRDADTQWPARARLHPLRTDQHQERASCGRSATARRREPLSRRAGVLAGLPASSVPQRRGARRHAAVDHQSVLLPGPDGRGAGSDRRRPL